MNRHALILAGRLDVASAVAAAAAAAGLTVSRLAATTDRPGLRRAIGTAGDLDLLVVIAPAFEVTALAALDETAVENGLAMTLDAAFVAVTAALPGLARRRGAVVLVGAITATTAFAQASLECAAMGGLVGLTRALAIEAGPDVRVNAVLHGPLDEADPRGRFALAGRVTPVDEVAAMVFAASRAGQGAVFTVDHGLSIGKRP